MKLNSSSDSSVYSRWENLRIIRGPGGFVKKSLRSDTAFALIASPSCAQDVLILLLLFPPLILWIRDANHHRLLHLVKTGLFEKRNITHVNEKLLLLLQHFVAVVSNWPKILHHCFCQLPTRSLLAPAGTWAPRVRRSCSTRISRGGGLSFRRRPHSSPGSP